jgi:NitT/TauT family transport system substrate-binding protein
MAIIKSVILSVIILLAVYTCSTAQNNKLIYTPHWLPQAQFAGYYVAQDQGFYDETGLEVEIIHPSASVNALRFLVNNNADVISLFMVTAINAIHDGHDLVNIAQLSQHSAIMFVCKKESGIESLQDFEGKKVGIWRSGFEEIPKAMLNEHNITAEWIPILSTVDLFLLGGVDVMTVMWYNEYNTIYLSGVNHDELNTFFMSDFDFNIPEDGLYTLRNTFENRQDDLRKFVEATMRGWEYAAANREYTVKLVVDLMHSANIPSNIPHQRWMLDKILETYEISKKEVQSTQLHPDDFYKAAYIIKDSRKTDKEIKYTDFFLPVMPALQKTTSP